jgi:hypothetical protein
LIDRDGGSVGPSQPGDDATSDPGELEDVDPRCELARLRFDTEASVEGDLEHALFEFEIREYLLIIWTPQGADPIECLIGLGEAGDENPPPRIIVGVLDGEIGWCGLTPCRCLYQRLETGAVDVDDGCTRTNIRIGHLGAGCPEHGIVTRREFGELIFGRVVEQ